MDQLTQDLENLKNRTRVEKEIAEKLAEGQRQNLEKEFLAKEREVRGLGSLVPMPYKVIIGKERGRR